MDPIYRGEDIRLDFTVTPNARDATHDYTGATFRLTTRAEAPLETHEYDLTPDDLGEGSATLHLDLTDTETSALSSRVHAVVVWCDEGADSQVVLADMLPVI